MSGDLSIQPYMFEPESDPEQQDNEENDSDQPRLQMHVNQWCTCGNCSTMPTEIENLCCKEIPKVKARMDEVSSTMTCMVDHPGLEPVCLNVYSLQNAINVYKAQFGPLRLRGIVHRYRYCSYRCFVSWCWGYLGRNVRVVLPSCVVLRIRQEFPDDEGRYVGFKPVLG